MVGCLTKDGLVTVFQTEPGRYEVRFREHVTMIDGPQTLTEAARDWALIDSPMRRRAMAWLRQIRTQGGRGGA